MNSITYFGLCGAPGNGSGLAPADEDEPPIGQEWHSTWRLLCSSSLGSILQPLTRKQVITKNELHGSPEVISMGSFYGPCAVGSHLRAGKSLGHVLLLQSMALRCFMPKRQLGMRTYLVRLFYSGHYPESPNKMVISHASRGTQLPEFLHLVVPQKLHRALPSPCSWMLGGLVNTGPSRACYGFLLGAHGYVIY